MRGLSLSLLLDVEDQYRQVAGQVGNPQYQPRLAKILSHHTNQHLEYWKAFSGFMRKKMAAIWVALNSFCYFHKNISMEIIHIRSEAPKRITRMLSSAQYFTSSNLKEVHTSPQFISKKIILSAWLFILNTYLSILFIVCNHTFHDKMFRIHLSKLLKKHGITRPTKYYKPSLKCHNHTKYDGKAYLEMFPG